MPFRTQLVHGGPTMVDHTPSGAIAAGEVVVTGDTPRIAHLDIAAGVLGALAAEGGVYRVAGDAAIAADKKVWWNSTANQITETASTHTVFGVTVSACSGAAAYCNARHDPAQ